MTAKQERELFFELCVSLEKRPPDCLHLKRIVRDWSHFRFDTGFEEYEKASALVAAFATQTVILDRLAKEVRAVGFLTSYTRAGASRVEPESKPTCLVSLHKCIQNWSFARPGDALAEASRLLSMHAATVRAAFEAEDEEGLRALLAWSGDAVLRELDAGLASELRAWLTKQKVKKTLWRKELNEGRLPSTLHCSPWQSELILLGCTHQPRMPLLMDLDILAWTRRFEERVLECQVKVLSLVDPCFMRKLELSVQFGQTVFLTDFCGSLPDNSGLLDLLLGRCFRVGNANLVRLGDNHVEISHDFRRYLVTESSELSIAPELDDMIVPIDSERQVFQIAFMDADDDGTTEVVCTSLGGVEITNLSINSNSATISNLVEAVAEAKGIETYEVDLVFPNAKSSRSFSNMALISEVI